MSDTVPNVVNEKIYISLELSNNNAPATGLSPILEIRRLSDGTYFDWTPGITKYWKSSGGLPSTIMAEKTWDPGFYVQNWDHGKYDPDRVDSYRIKTTTSYNDEEIIIREIREFHYSYEKAALAVVNTPVYSSMTIPGSIGDVLATIKGLVQGDQYMDEMVYEHYEGVPLLVSGRIRIYSNPADVGTDENIISTFRITSDWTNNTLQTYKVVAE